MAKHKQMYNLQPHRKEEEMAEITTATRRGNTGTAKRTDLAQRDFLLFLDDTGTHHAQTS